MAEKNIKSKIVLRNDTSANWTSNNPVLLSGELGYETDTGKFKIGNGTSNWSALSYSVSTVNDKTGDVTLSASDIGLGNVDNTSDADKPISTAQQTAFNTLEGKVQRAGMLGNEGRFGVLAFITAMSHELSTFMYETFTESSDIDQTKDDGAYVVANYFNADLRSIIKNDDTTKRVQSKIVTRSISPTKAWAFLDYEGTGTVTIQFTENDGEDWDTLQNDTLTNLPTRVGTDLRLRLVMQGVVKVKNVAWGCK